jgi:hypothetical protein
MNDQEISQSDLQKENRVLAVGDSQTFAIGASTYESWPKLPMAGGGFAGTWQRHAENPGKRYFQTSKRIIAGGRVWEGMPQEAVHGLISPGPTYRLSVR